MCCEGSQVIVLPCMLFGAALTACYKQLDDLTSNLKKAENLISSCPACKANFFNLFCTFTCSPDQSLFLDVLRTQRAGSGKDIVTELDYYVHPTYSSGFYDSCKDLKFSATGGLVMDLIGGGANNYTEFLKFLGDEKPFGSPFQINYPHMDKIQRGMEAMRDMPKKCNDEDEAYRCACVDCPAACPVLPGVKEDKECRVGAIPCWSLSVVIIYSVFLLITLGGYAVHLAMQKQRERRSVRLPLLQDPTLSDDEDEGDILNAGLLDRPLKEYYLNTYLDYMFQYLGQTCALYPAVTIGISVIMVGLLSLGWIWFSVETDPVRLWVSPTSDAAMEKRFFDDNFGPFYRTEQVFLVNDTTSAGPAPVLSYDTLRWWFDVEQQIRRMKSISHGYTLQDVCLNPTGAGCVVQSIAGYFNDDFWAIKDPEWKDQLRQCTKQPVTCLPDFGQPLKKELVLGGWQDIDDIVDSKALIVTWVLNNYAEGSWEEERAMDWERSLKGTLHAVKEEARERGLRLSFSTEISLEEELNKSTNTDAKIVVVSYVAMFIYASLALGSTTRALRNILTQPSRALVDSKFTLGIFGIIIVLMSVSASVGLFSAMGIKVTLIIAEVIPFLVLAVGVDNIFLIVHEFERANYAHPDEAIELRIAKAMGRMGPSILLSATSETVAFALGAIVTMPAVRNFAIYAAGAVFINALLQVTMFVAVLSLNQKRVESGRMDCFPCVRAPRNSYANSIDTQEHNVGASILGTSRTEGGHIAAVIGVEEEGILEKIIRKKYAPVLLQKMTKSAVLICFLGVFAAALALLPEVELGLDQRIAIPNDSYLIGYFNDLYDYFAVGPPVYFITRDYNITERSYQKALCGRFSTCNSLSLSNVVEQERKRSEMSYIAEPAASWIDDFFLWLNPSLGKCCRVRKSDSSQLCKPNDYPFQCKACFKDRDPAWNISLYGMPEGSEFMDYLDIWINAPSDEDCPIAGKAAYSAAIVPDFKRNTISASHFRSSHTPLASQEDFINAYASARRIAKDISRAAKTHVFPYSKFYIFFDQYASIVRLTAGLICAALGCILIVSSILLGSLKTGFIVSITVAMIVVDVLGIMAIWGVSLNAVSLVNLVICVGIGVEFCSHIARAFMFPSRSILERAKVKFRGHDARAWASMVNVGGSVSAPIPLVPTSCAE